MGSWWRPWQLTRHDKKEDIDSSRAMSPFILAIAILDFWWMSISRDTGSGTIKKFDLENMGIAVGILLLYVLEFEIMSGSKIPPVAGKRRKKTAAGTRVLHYAYFQTVCSQTNVYVESSYFARNASIFTCSKSTFEKFTRNRNPGPLLTGLGMETEEREGGKWLNGSYL